MNTAPQRAEADDHPDVDPELAGVAGDDRIVDYVRRDPDNRDLRDLARRLRSSVETTSEIC